MKNMTIRNIAEACGGELVGADAVLDAQIQGAVIDSRLVEKDYLFFAIKGEKVDGHEYIRAVHEKGALAAVCERVPEGCDGACIVVENTVEALKKIAEFYRQSLEDITVVGITGSVGKTTTKEFIASVLSQKFEVLKTEGNLNNQIGLPLTILKIRDNHKVAVVEMGINDFGEMTRLSKIARPDICVITNIGECHLEKLGTRDGVLKAKTEIFEYMNPEGDVVIFGDDDKLSTIKEVNGKKPITYGLEKTNDVYPTKTLNRGLWGNECTIENGEGTFKVSIPLPGKHMILNTLAASAVARIMDVPANLIATGITNVKTLAGRTNVMQKNNLTIIDDCYNANPVSMKSAVDLLKESVTPTVAVLGDMFELGENTEELHEDVGKYAADKGVNKIVCVGTLAKKMYEKAMVTASVNDKTEVLYFATVDEAIENIPNFINKDDAVLVKASNGMKFSRIVDALTSDELKNKLNSRNENLFPTADTSNLQEKKSDGLETLIQEKNEDIDGEKADNAISQSVDKENGREAENKEADTVSKKVVDFDKKEQKDVFMQILIIAGCVIVVAALVFAGIMIGKHNKYDKETRGLVVASRDGKVITAGVIEDRILVENDVNVNFVDGTKNGFEGVQYDGKYIYFLTNSPASLMRVSDSGKDLKILANEDVEPYVISKGTVLYKGPDGVYLYTAKEDTTQILEGSVKAYRLSDDKKAVFTLGNDGKLNYTSLEKVEDVANIDENVTEIISVSANAKTVVYAKNDGVYFNTGRKESVKISESYTGSWIPANEKGDIVYFTDDENNLYYFKAGSKKCKLVSKDPQTIECTDFDEAMFILKEKDDSYRIVKNGKSYAIKDALFDGSEKFVGVDAKTSEIFYTIKDAQSTPHSTLYSIKIKGLFKKGRIEVKDTNVDSIDYVDGRNILVTKDNALYHNTALVSKDVVANSVKKCVYGDEFTFALQNKTENGFYDIYIYDGKEMINIGSSISIDYLPVSKKMIYCLVHNDSQFDVVMYNGKKEKTVLEDVDSYLYLKY